MGQFGTRRGLIQLPDHEGAARLARCGLPRGRFNLASQHPESPDKLFIPLFDTLNWAGALEEDMRPHAFPMLMALRFVRDPVLHSGSRTP